MDNQIKMPTNRNFGVTIGSILIIVQVYLFYKFGIHYLILILLSSSILILGLLDSKILKPLNILWFNFGRLLGMIISPIFLLLFFILIFTPYGIFGRIFYKEIANIKYNKMNDKNSFWENSNKENNYEKQY